MRMLITIVIGVALLLALVVGLFSWANQPTCMHDTGGGSRLGIAFVGSSSVSFLGVVVLIAIVKLRNSNWWS
jgi:hypothetical protein